MSAPNPDSKSRNWLGTIVFTDIVGYSVHSVEDQITIKEHYNRLISECIRALDESERVIVDTGDGAALCFLGDPEAAMEVIMALRREITTGTLKAPVPYEVRTGINIGPVRLVTDINGQYNILGDGINIAQRVMSFARPGQVMVARSFYDVAWCLSDKYSTLFRYYGMRKDKHIREHILYELRGDDAASEFPSGEPPTQPEPEKETITRMLRTRLSNDTAPLSHKNWDRDQLREIENDMMGYLGPLAKVVVRKAAARTVSEEDLYVRLAGAIPAGEDRVAFLEKASDVLDEETRTTLLQPATGPDIAVPTGKAVPTQAETLKTGATATPVSGRSSMHDWPPDVIETAVQRLAVHVGPLAGMLVRKASRRCQSVPELYRLLASEIGDTTARKAFLSHVANSDTPSSG